MCIRDRTSEVSQIQAQNLSTQLAVPNSKDEIAQLKMCIRDSTSAVVRVRIDVEPNRLLHTSPEILEPVENTFISR